MRSKLLMPGAFLIGLWVAPNTYADGPPVVVQPELVESEEESAPGDEDVAIELENSVEADSVAVIEGIHFSGGQSLNIQALAKNVEFLIGTQYDKVDVKKAVDLLSDQYKSAGFPLTIVTVGKNGFADGILTFTIVEGFVARSEVVVEDQSVSARIDAILAPLINERPTTNGALYRAIALIKKIPGYRFSFALPKPKTLSGATTLRVEQKSVTLIEPVVGLVLQEDADESVSLGARVFANSKYLESLEVTTLLPLADANQKYFAATLKHALGNDGLTSALTLKYYLDKDTTSIPFADGRLNIANNIHRRSGQFSLSYPLVLNQRQQSNLSFGLLIESEEGGYELFFNETPIIRVDETLRYLFASLSLQNRFAWDNFTASAGVSIHQSVPAVFSETDTLGTAPLFDSGMTFYRANLALSYEFVPDWIGSFRSRGLYANESIVPSQRFSIGGFLFGRGYPEGVLEGDRATAQS